MTQEITMTPATLVPANTASILCKIQPTTPVFDAGFLMLQIACWVIAIIGFYLMIRTVCVGRFRKKLLREWDIQAESLMKEGKPWHVALDWYHDIPDFDDMMRAFWVWPLSKFVDESCASYVARKMEIHELVNKKEESTESTNQ